jgi:hypothetical protein
MNYEFGIMNLEFLKLNVLNQNTGLKGNRAF